VDRCIEEMCSDEPFSIYKYGDVESLNHIDNINLYEHYKNLLSSSPIEISVVGNLDENFVLDTINKVLKFKREKTIDIQREEISIDTKNIKEKIDEMDVNQGKLKLKYLS